jgi:hypothetical protein
MEPLLSGQDRPNVNLGLGAEKEDTGTKYKWETLKGNQILALCSQTLTWQPK